MSRIPREATQTNIFHVIVQGLAKENIFGEEVFAKNYLFNINLFKKDDEIKVLAYCVMPNHCHLLLHVPNSEKMGHFMKRVNTRFASFYNLKKDRVGYVFRDRYKSQAIFDTSYLTNCIVYIHNNPVKAGIVSNPLDFAYSSLNDYMYGFGLVDFDVADQYFEPSKENILAIMKEYGSVDGSPEWIDIKDEQTTVEDKAFEILSSYNMPPRMLRLDDKLLYDCCKRLSDAGLSYKQIASILSYKSHVSIVKILKTK